MTVERGGRDWEDRLWLLEVGRHSGRVCKKNFEEYNDWTEKLTNLFICVFYHRQTNTNSNFFSIFSRSLSA